MEFTEEEITLKEKLKTLQNLFQEVVPKINRAINYLDEGKTKRMMDMFFEFSALLDQVAILQFQILGLFFVMEKK